MGEEKEETRWRWPSGSFFVGVSVALRLLWFAGLGDGVDGDFVGFAEGIYKLFNFCGVGGGVDHD